MAPRPLLIRGGRIVDPAAGLDTVGDLLIVDGRVAARGPATQTSPDGARLIDAAGLVVCPGFVDLHTHLRYPGFPDKETVATGTLAAAAGGYTTVCAMANTRPVVDSPLVLAEVMAEVARSARVRVHQLAAVTRDLAGETLTDFPALAAGGAVAFSDDGKPVWRTDVMEDALRLAGRLDKPISVHEEDPDIVGPGVANAGEPARRLGLWPWPCEGETTMVARDIRLLAATGGHLHIAHASCAGTVPLLRAAQEHGLRVTAEVTPHHLRLTDRLLEGDEALGLPPGHPCTKVNPPLRSAEDRAAVIEALVDGTIGAIATDHAPHHADDKSQPYATAAFGLSMIETALPLALELVREGHLDLSTLIERMTWGPARIFGLEAGTLTAGAPADVCLFDPEERWTLTAEALHSRGKNSPLLGATLTGQVVCTVVGGEEVYSRR